MSLSNLTDREAVAVGKRNPAWVRDELILALDLYMQHRPSLPPETGAEELSGLLNKMRGPKSALAEERYRNVNAVSLKLNNFRRFDPDYVSRGKVGMKHGGKGDEAVWQDFSDDLDRLHKIAAAIRAQIAIGQTLPADDNADSVEIEEASEGAILTRLHRQRERSRKLVQRREERALKAHGRLLCEACTFDFWTFYGPRGEGYIECHHVRPVYALKPGEKTHIDDLALICANCHRMIHARRP